MELNYSAYAATTKHATDIRDPHLYPPIQQLTGQDLQGGAVSTGESGQSAEQMRGTGVPDHVTRVQHVQNLKVIVDGVAHHHLAFKYTKDLKERSQCHRKKKKLHGTKLFITTTSAATNIIIIIMTSVSVVLTDAQTVIWSLILWYTSILFNRDKNDNIFGLIAQLYYQ